MNVELLTKVMNRLKRMRHKKHFNMNDWIQENECGTAACIAGHALLIEGYKAQFKPSNCTCPMCNRGRLELRAPNGRKVKPENAARRLLQLSEGQASRLFRAQHWPFKFYQNSGDAYNDPKVAAARIQHFIDTKGKE